MSYRLEAIPALKDNYIWCLYHTGNHRVLVVDPGEAGPVQHFLQDNGLSLDAILITHHHPDHVAGVQQLLGDTSVPVYGPSGSSFKGITHSVAEGDRVTWLDLSFDVIAVPGHTLDHIAFNCTDRPLDHPISFCGDLLFVCGCGRLFEGSAEQMRHSLSKLCRLPNDTLICGGHEYTLANLAFARTVNPGDEKLQAFESECKAMRDAGKPTVPTQLGSEKRLNPFLQWDNNTIAQAALNYGKEAGLTVDPENPDQVFAAIRHWKDNF
jgi:hydroxyacylglutathione hydrolase